MIKSNFLIRARNPLCSCILPTSRHARSKPSRALRPERSEQPCATSSGSSSIFSGATILRHCGAGSAVACKAGDSRDVSVGRQRGGSKAAAGFQFNPVYAAICGGFALLMLFQNPYIFAGLTILTIMPQNSSTTSLNSLVLLFYDSGAFMNFAEAVYCVRLVSWLSIAFTLISFAIFA